MRPLGLARMDAGSWSNRLTLAGHNSGAASPASAVGSSLLLQPTSGNIQIRALGRPYNVVSKSEKEVELLLKSGILRSH